MESIKIGVIGLGRMGESIVYRLLQNGHKVVGFDFDKNAQERVKKIGAQIVTSLEELPAHVSFFWIMVPAGKPVDDVITKLLPHVKKNDVIIDGGNSHFFDSQRRHKMLREKYIHFLDCGVSGGLKGREIGFSIMVGGEKKVFEEIEPVLKALSAKNGYGYMGPAGAGHYVKMVHNGIEYALLQSFAEGFHLLHENKTYKDLDLAEVSRVWSNGSVIRSWLCELSHEIFSEDKNLESISGEIGENKTGRWTQKEAEKEQIPVKLIEDALDVRAWSRKSGGNFATKVVAMFRNKFGGHEVKKK